MLQRRRLDNETWVAVYTAYDWVLFAIPTPFVIIRFFVQFHILRKRDRKTYLRELLVLASWLFFTAYVIMYSLLARPYIVERRRTKEVVDNVKLQYTAFLMFMSSIFGCKIFLLWFYFDLIPKNSLKRLWWCNVAALVFNVAVWMAECLYQFFWCRPMKADWLRFYDPSWIPYCTSPGIFDAIAWSLHMCTDIIVYIIPILIIDKLAILSFKKRIEAAVVFALGFISVGCAVAIVILNVRRDFYGEDTFGVETAYAMLMLPQMATALLVVCVVQIRVFTRWLAGRNNDSIVESSGSSVREMQELGQDEETAKDSMALARTVKSCSTVESSSVPPLGSAASSIDGVRR